MRCIRNGILMNRKATGFVTLPRRTVSNLSFLPADYTAISVHRMTVINLTIEARILEICPYNHRRISFFGKLIYYILQNRDTRSTI